MANWYVNRSLLKDALGIPASATGDHDQLDAVAEAVSRLFDDYLGFHVYPASGTRFFTPWDSQRLYLDAPLLNIDAVQTSSDGGSTFGTTVTSDAYYVAPYNATEQSPRQPWWELEIRPQTTASGAVFPLINRSTRILGTWGYYDERRNTTAAPATAINATQTIWDMTGASNLRAGMTIRVGAEQVFIERNALDGSATAATSGQILVRRAQNGTTGATHSNNSTISIYEYPIIERAALYQAQMDYRAKDTPLGMAGGTELGTQRMFAQGGLHPFVLRMLAPFRKPVAI